MDNQRSAIKNRLFFLCAIVVVLGIYCYPAIKTAATTGFRGLPPIFAPDLSLYLNISLITKVNSTEAVSPYYGVAVPIVRMGYLKFRLAFLLFGKLIALLRGDLWWAVLLWNLFWWGLLAIFAGWLFQRFLPENSPELVCAALALLLFFDFAVLRDQMAAWAHLPSLHGFRGLTLPYMRAFFPQVPIPLLIFYLGLQMDCLRKGRWWLWTAMGITQFLAFATFPYAMLMMAGITAVGVLGQFMSGANPVRWSTVSIYAVACAAGNFLFISHGGGMSRTGAPGQYSLIHIQPALLPHLIGGMWFLLAVLTALVGVSGSLSVEVRWPLVGLGLSNLFLMVGDAFFSATALQVSDHAGYFVQLTAAVLATFLISAGFRYTHGRKFARPVALGAIAILVANGMLISHAVFQASLPGNQGQADLARFLQSDQTQSDDLVIARSLSVDDDCAWVPLASRAHVLFCRSAQVLFSPEQNQQIQRFRQALYLFFTNRDDRWVEQVLNDPSAVGDLTRLTFLGQVATDPAERKQGVEEVRAELVPQLTRVEQKDPIVQAFFAVYRRILVIDNSARPFFAESRLTQYLKIENRETLGTLKILVCSPQT